eukprot:6290327-Amphidinium_carterae.1
MVYHQKGQPSLPVLMQCNTSLFQHKFHHQWHTCSSLNLNQTTSCAKGKTAALTGGAKNGWKGALKHQWGRLTSTRDRHNHVMCKQASTRLRASSSATAQDPTEGFSIT